MKKRLSKAAAAVLVACLSLSPNFAFASQSNVSVASEEASPCSFINLTKSVSIDDYVVATVTYTYNDSYGKATGIQNKSLKCKGTASSATYVQCYIESGGKSIFVKVCYYRSDYGWKTSIGRIYV